MNYEVLRCSSGSQILPLLSTTADSLYHCCTSGYMATKPAKTPKPNKKTNSTLNNQHAPYHLTSKPQEDFGHCCIPDHSLPFLLEFCMFQLSVFTLQEGSAALAPFPAQEALSWCQSALLALGSLANTPFPVSLWKVTSARSHPAAPSAVQTI